MEFIELIKNAIDIIEEEMNQKEKQIFVDRYKKMIEYLKKLAVAYQSKTIYKKDIYLNIVRMLDHGDSEMLQEAVTKVNHYYQKYIYEE